MPPRHAAVRRQGDRLGDVADEDRLEARLRTGQGQHREEAREVREAVEEAVARSEDQRGAEDHRVGAGGEHRGLALGFGPGIARLGVRVGPDRRDVDHRGAGPGRRPRDLTRAVGLQAREALGSGLLEDADEVDHYVRARDRPRDRIRVAQVRLHGDDLPDLSERLKEQGEVGPADGDANAVAALGQSPDHVPSEKAGAAEDRDQLRCWPRQGRGRQNGVRSAGAGHRLVSVYLAFGFGGVAAPALPFLRPFSLTARAPRATKRRTSSPSLKCARPTGSRRSAIAAQQPAEPERGGGDDRQRGGLVLLGASGDTASVVLGPATVMAPAADRLVGEGAAALARLVD